MTALYFKVKKGFIVNAYKTRNEKNKTVVAEHRN